eukprot:jgi/Ulvmu1/1075/UM105_0034.1
MDVMAGWSVRCRADIPTRTLLAAFTGIVAVNSQVADGSRYVITLDHYLDAADELHRFPHIPHTALPDADPRTPLLDYNATAYSSLRPWHLPAPNRAARPPRAQSTTAHPVPRADAAWP